MFCGNWLSNTYCRFIKRTPNTNRKYKHITLTDREIDQNIHELNRVKERLDYYVSIIRMYDREEKNNIELVGIKKIKKTDPEYRETVQQTLALLQRKKALLQWLDDNNVQVSQNYLRYLDVL